MKKNFVFATLLVLVALSISAMAQEKRAAGADFSGKWTLDIAKSELGQAAGMIKSETLTITQAGTSFKVSTATERNPQPDTGGGAGGGAGAPGARSAGGGMGGSNEQSYTLDGKEVSAERQTPNGAVTIKSKAEQTGSKIVLSTINPGPNGDMKTTRTYELSADGKALTLTTESPRGTNKKVYTKAS
jgi:hypothetical protein